MIFFSNSLSNTRRGMIISFVACVVASVTPVRAQDDIGAFAGLPGTWAGDGTVAMVDGTSEKLHCRATYSLPPVAAALNQMLKCASTSYEFDVVSFVSVDSGGVLSGTWSETTHRVTGELTGRASPGLIQTAVEGLGFSAQLSVATHGARQSVSITPTGTDVRLVTIEMKRS